MGRRGQAGSGRTPRRAALEVQPSGEEASAGLEQIARLRTPTASPTAEATPTLKATSPLNRSPTAAPASTPWRTPTPSRTPAPIKTSAPACRLAKNGLIGFARADRCNARSSDACGPPAIWVTNRNANDEA